MKIDYIRLSINKTDSLFLPYIITDTDFILIDTGYPDMMEQIEDKLSEKGLSLANLTQLWITHHDHDHIGSLAEIKRNFPGIIIKASKAETPYIQGEEVSLRLSQAISQQASLAAAEQDGGLGFQAYLKSIMPCQIDDLLTPGQLLLDGQIKVLDTSGHTAGHISFYAPESQTLLAGDAVVAEKGILKLPFPQYSYDLEQAKRSIVVLADLPIKQIICCHGGVISGSKQELKIALCAASLHCVI